MSDITFAPLIPLIGGFPLGAADAFETQPTEIFSYDGFQANDGHYVKYIQETLGHSTINYTDLDQATSFNQVDVVVGTPPCAALSQLNTGKSTEVKGATCEKNDWMYRVFEDGIDKLNAKVVIVENAPALFTNKGKDVAARLWQIASERGYSLTLYRTSTMYHGIPQDRRRTFAIAWKSDAAPIMNFYRRDRSTFKEYLATLSGDEVHSDVIINEKLHQDGYYAYVKAHTNRDPRDLLAEGGHKTAFQYVNKNGLLKDALRWFEETGHERGVKYATHAIKKFDQGLGIWDNSTHVFPDVMNAVIGRNMSDTIHPTEDRSLSVREALYMMGFPNDFEMIKPKQMVNHIAQNVPVCTARDMCLEIRKFLEGQLPMSEAKYLRQDNMNKTTKNVVEAEKNTLDGFIS